MPPNFLLYYKNDFSFIYSWYQCIYGIFKENINKGGNDMAHPKDLLSNLPRVGAFSIVTNVDDMSKLQKDYHNSVHSTQLLSETTLYNKTVLYDAREILEKDGIVALTSIGSEYYMCDFEKFKEYSIQNGMTYAEISQQLADGGIDITNFEKESISDAVLGSENYFDADKSINDDVTFDRQTQDIGDEPR